MAAQGADEPVDTLRRWEAAGGTWRVVAVRGDEVTVGLFTCDGAEEMSRVTIHDANLRTFVAGHADPSDDEGR